MKRFIEVESRFIEVESIVYDMKGEDCGFISVLINVADISTIEERHYILDEKDGIAITMKNNREFLSLETMEEIKKKIAQAECDKRNKGE